MGEGGGVKKELWTNNARCSLLRKPHAWGEAGISRGMVMLGKAAHHGSGRGGIATDCKGV